MASIEKKQDVGICPVSPDEQAHRDGETIEVTPSHTDRAATFLAQFTDYAPLTPEQEKRLKRKLDRWMIPMLLFTATLVRSHENVLVMSITDAL